jgi:hypothetical protein
MNSYLTGGLLGLKACPGCRANGAEVTSPGQRPGYRARELSSALKGRRNSPASLQGAQITRMGSATQGVALG